MADAIPLLESLHPLREPPPPASIAPYLIMAGAGILVAVLVALATALVLGRRLRVRRAAAAELALSRSLPPDERLAAQAMLLRRLVRTTAGEDDARQQGPAWLERLDSLFATTFFSDGEGRAFGAALYAPGPRPDVDALDRSLAGFIARVRQ